MKNKIFIPRQLLNWNPNKFKQSKIASLDDVRDVINTISTSTEHPDWTNKLRIVSCVIRRNVGTTTWNAIKPPGDTGHETINVASVTADSSVITINYSITFTKVVFSMAQVDEVYRGIYEVGTSGGFTSSQISVSRTNGLPAWGGDLDYNGSTWTFNQRYGSGSTTVSGGTTKTITLTHSSDDCGLHSLGMRHTWDGTPPFTNASLSGTSSVIRIPAGYTPVNGDSIWIERFLESSNQTINPINTGSFPANMASDTGNIWFFAIGYIA